MRLREWAGARSLLLAVVAVLGLVIVALVFTPDLFRQKERKNIVLIVADTLRADRLGCYGFKRDTSPNIDRLAEEGVRFENYSTVVPTTLASFTSLFTSNFPKDHGAPRNLIAPFDDLETLAEAFREEGYETAAFISSFCLNSKFGLDRGFDFYDETLDETTALPDNSTIRTARSVTDAFIKWHSDRDDDRPFFAVVHYFDPHFPYCPPERYIKYVTDRTPRRKRALWQDVYRAKNALKKSGGRPTEWHKEMHDLHCAEIRYMDDEIGRIVARFRSGVNIRGGEVPDTVLAFTSDHGETFWDHTDFFNHGVAVYQTTIHIPLVINCPGFVENGVVSRVPLSNIDLAPALCRLAGVEIPGTFRGEGGDVLLAALTVDGLVIDEAKRLRFAEATMPYEVEEGARRPNYKKAKSIRRGPWKYVEVPHLDSKGMLFNIETDPKERRDLAGDPEYAPLVARMKEQLWNWADDFDSKRDRSRTSNEEDAKKVKDIGY